MISFTFSIAASLLWCTVSVSEQQLLRFMWHYHIGLRAFCFLPSSIWITSCLYSCTRFYIFSSHSTETKGEAAGSTTAVIVVVVIVIICLLGAASVFLALKYMAKSPEVTPVMEEKKSGSQGETKRKRRKKLKHSSSTTGVGEGPGVSKTPEAQGGEKKKRRRKRSRVGGQN